MNNNITTYYIPTNPNINKGTIYTLYINKNTNLDLTSIINEVPSLNPTNIINLNKQIEEIISNLTKINQELKTLSIKELKNE